MISVAMLALAAGYSLGGWIADRKPTEVVYFIVLGSGVYQLLIVLAVRSVLLKLWQMGDSPELATVIIFVPPMTTTVGFPGWCDR
jgi:hypothetical protein